MTSINRASWLTLPLLFSAVIAAGACSDSNDPAVTDSDSMLMGGSNSEPDATNTEPDATSAGGSGGDSSDSGGAPSTGGAPNTDDLALGDPPCALSTTAGGEEPKKGVQCTDEDIQACWRQCGPQSIGWKLETCQAGVYAEGDCQFDPDVDYSCFSVPEEIDASCPADVPPQATDECDVAECTLCNVNSSYFDSGGNSKVGYCVCVPGVEEGDPGKWSCASATAWPCPLGKGC